MEADAYMLMAAHETHHWWFVGRRAVIRGLLARMDLPEQARVVEAGCGTGGNLYMLQRHGRVFAFEPHDEAVEIARQRNPDVVVASGAIPDESPFEEGSFDLVAALDVLEHVEDDAAAMRSLVRLGKPGAYVLVTVPAHQALWGSHDRRLHHVRRYSAARLRALCDVPGIEIEYFGAFNTVLAPIAVTMRLLERFTPLRFGNQERMPAPTANRVLSALFSLEGWIVQRFRIPFGLSYAAILRVSTTQSEP